MFKPKSWSTENKKLHVPLVSPHATCRQSQGQGQTQDQGQRDKEIVSCSGKTKVQNYTPRNFGFSIGFDCNWKRKVSLNGIGFNISVEQTNNTKCVPISEAEKQVDMDCSNLYSAASFPNVVGDQTLFESVQSVKHFVSNFGEKATFYKYFWEFVCYTFLPKCNSTQNHLVLPCKDVCNDFRKAYQNKIWQPVGNNQIDCDYFPPLNGPIPCFYERVTCQPPSAPNIIFHGRKRNVYPVGSSVKYSGCLFTGEMTKDAGETKEYFYETTRCLYNGKWSDIRQSHCNPKGAEIAMFLCFGIFLFYVLVGVIVWMVSEWRYNNDPPKWRFKKNTSNGGEPRNEIPTQRKRK